MFIQGAHRKPPETADHAPPEGAVFQVTGAGNESVNGYYAIHPSSPTHNGRQQWRKMKEDGSVFGAREQGVTDVFYKTQWKSWGIYIKTGTSWPLTYEAVGDTPLPPTDGWTHDDGKGTDPCPQLKWISKLVCW